MLYHSKAAMGVKIFWARYFSGPKIAMHFLLSFSGPLHFHRNFLNNALFLKLPLDYHKNIYFKGGIGLSKK